MGLLSKFGWCCWCHVPRTPDVPLPDSEVLQWKSLEASGPIKLRCSSQESVHAGLGTVRFVVISDTHGRHEELDLPAGDVLLHCGDWSNYRTSRRDVREFNAWLGTLPFKHKVVISGNHDVAAVPGRKGQTAAILSNCIYLEDSPATVEGVKLYGMPWRPRRGCCYKAENFGADPAALAARIEAIPSDTDVLLTHGPPFGVMDAEPAGRIGDSQLLAHVLKHARPVVHVFGHVHHERGSRVSAPHEGLQTMWINASSCAGDAKSGGLNPPFVFDLAVADTEGEECRRVAV